VADIGKVKEGVLLQLIWRQMKQTTPHTKQNQLHGETGGEGGAERTRPWRSNCSETTKGIYHRTRGRRSSRHYTYDADRADGHTACKLHV